MTATSEHQCWTSPKQTLLRWHFISLLVIQKRSVLFEGCQTSLPFTQFNCVHKSTERWWTCWLLMPRKHLWWQQPRQLSQAKESNQLKCLNCSVPTICTYLDHKQNESNQWMNSNWRYIFHKCIKVLLPPREIFQTTTDDKMNGPGKTFSVRYESKYLCLQLLCKINGKCLKHLHSLWAICMIHVTAWELVGLNEAQKRKAS